MDKENKVEVKDGVRTLEKDIQGRHYTFKGIKYRRLKELKKTAGENVQLLNDMMILDSVVEPKLTMNEIDEMDLADIIAIQKAVAEVTGIDPNSIKGF